MNLIGHRIDSIMEVHHAPHMLFICKYNQFLCLLQRGGERLLTDKIHTVLNGALCNFIMGMVGRTDMDGIKLQLVKHLPIIAVGPGDVHLLGLFFCPHSIAQGDHLNISQSAECLHMGSADKTGANNRCFIHFVTFFSTEVH